MSNLYRFLLAVIAILVIGFFAIKPYNNFCNLKGICKPLYWYNIFPKADGYSEFEVRFKALNYHENLEFEVVEPELIKTFPNRVNIVEFRVKNISQKLITFRPELIIEPVKFSQYLEKYECLCMQNYSLKGGEEKILKMIFAFNDKIEIDEEFYRHYPINYDNIDKSELKELKIMYSIANTY